MLALLLLAVPARAAVTFTEDFESGVLVPPWDAIYTVPLSTLTSSTAAGHQGTRGLRLVDGSTESGQGHEQWVQHRYVENTSSLYVRVWLRPLAASSVGDIIFLQINDSSGNRSLLDVSLTNAGPLLFGEGGYDSAGAYTFVPGATAFTVGPWLLVETMMTGLGTASGARQLWVNGALVGGETLLNWTTSLPGDLKLGGPWTNDRRFNGTLDFDDLRTSDQPIASQLRLSAPDITAVGHCVLVTLQLLDTPTHSLAPAPYPVVANLTVSGVAGAFYSNSDCTTPVSSASLGAGESAATTYFQPSEGGTASLSATHPAFLGGTGSITVTTDGQLPSPWARPPATPSSRPPPSSSLPSDSGVGPSPDASVGCGCRQGSAGEWLFLAAVVLPWGVSGARFKRRSRRAP